MSRRRPPLSPEAAAVLRALTGSGSPATSGLSRRALLAGAGGLGLGAVLAACGTSGTATSPGGGGSASGSPSAGPSPAQDQSATEKVVNWSNWPLYLDVDDKTKKLPDARRRSRSRPGSRSTYAEDINDNDDVLRQDPGPAASGPGHRPRRHRAAPTGWPAGSIRLGCVQKLDDGDDPERQEPAARAAERRATTRAAHYSLPWQCGLSPASPTTSSRSRPRQVEDRRRPVATRSSRARSTVLHRDARHHGPHHAAARATTSAKPSPTTSSTRRSPCSRRSSTAARSARCTGNDYKEDLHQRRRRWPCIGWSGDVVQLNAENGEQAGSSSSPRPAACCGATTS